MINDHFFSIFGGCISTIIVTFLYITGTMTPEQIHKKDKDGNIITTKKQDVAILIFRIAFVTILMVSVSVIVEKLVK